MKRIGDIALKSWVRFQLEYPDEKLQKKVEQLIAQYIAWAKAIDKNTARRTK